MWRSLNAAEGRAEAARRIHACLESGSDTLYLGDLGLEAWPEELGDCTDLKHLYVGRSGPVIYVGRSGPETNAAVKRGAVNNLPAPSAALLRRLPRLETLELIGQKRTSAALATLVEETDLTAFIANDAGLKDADIALLRGWRRLKHLDLAENDLGPAAAQQLRMLPALRRLDLAFNQIDRTGVRYIAEMTELTALELSQCAFDERDAKHLGALVNLTELGLSEIYVEGSGLEFDRLQKLEYLGLNWSAADVEQLEVIAALPRLNTLLAGWRPWEDGGCGPDGAKALSAATGLVYLDIGGAQIGDKGALALARLENLVELQIYSNEIGPKGARVFANFRKLERLNADDNPLGAGVAALSGLPKLQTAHLDQCSAEDAKAMTPMPALKEIELADDALDLELATALTEMPALEIIRVEASHACPEAIATIASLPKLKQFKLSCEDCVDIDGAAALAALGAAENLRELSLPDARIGDAGARALAGLTELEELTLCDPTITAEGVRAIAALPNLRNLVLTGVQIDDAGLEALSARPTLRRLALTGDALSSLASLARLPELRMLEITGGRFQDLAAPLWRQPNLRFVSFDDARLADAPAELTAGRPYDNRLKAIRAYCDEIESGETVLRRNMKLFILGDADAGKSAVANHLAGRPFTPGASSRHETRLIRADFKHIDDAAPTPLDIWDHGAGEIKTGAAAFHWYGRGVYLIAWTAADPDPGEPAPWRGRGPISLHLEEIHDRVGAQAEVIVVQTKTDLAATPVRLPYSVVELFETPPRIVAMSAKTGAGAETLAAALEEAFERVRSRTPDARESLAIADRLDALSARRAENLPDVPARQACWLMPDELDARPAHAPPSSCEVLRAAQQAGLLSGDADLTDNRRYLDYRPMTRALVAFAEPGSALTREVEFGRLASHSTNFSHLLKREFGLDRLDIAILFDLAGRLELVARRRANYGLGSWRSYLLVHDNHENADQWRREIDAFAEPRLEVRITIKPYPPRFFARLVHLLSSDERANTLRADKLIVTRGGISLRSPTLERALIEEEIDAASGVGELRLRAKGRQADRRLRELVSAVRLLVHRCDRGKRPRKIEIAPADGLRSDNF